MRTREYPPVAPDFGHWLAGFVDGEGCFQISRNPNGAMFCSLQVRLREDDAEILAAICQTTGVGRLYHRRVGRASLPNAAPQAVWQASAREDCRQLVALFDAYPLRAKKARDYVIWREAVLLWVSQPWGTSRDWQPLAVLKDQLHTTRRYRAVARERTRMGDD